MSSSAVRASARTGLLVVAAFVAITAFLGGTALVLGVIVPSLTSVLTPPVEYLDGTPFSSYLIPGIVLAVVVAGTQAIAFAMELRRHPWADAATAVAGFAVLVWIFVQMVFIPFSFLQAAYFLTGLLEVGLVMVRLGLFAPVPEPVSGGQ